MDVPGGVERCEWMSLAASSPISVRNPIEKDAVFGGDDRREWWLLAAFYPQYRSSSDIDCICKGFRQRWRLALLGAFLGDLQHFAIHEPWVDPVVARIGSLRSRATQMYQAAVSCAGTNGIAAKHSACRGDAECMSC
jgi:hypothetical protein